MKPFVKPVPPGESGVGSGSVREPFSLLFLSQGRFWVFWEFTFRCQRQSVLMLGVPQGNWGFQASIDANVA